MNIQLDIKTLVADLGHDDMMRSAEAEEALYSASQAAIPELCEALLHSPNVRVRRKSAWIIYKIASRVNEPGLRDQALTTLIEALHDSDEGVRRNAPWGLSVIGGTRAKSALQAAMQDRSGDVRDAAEYALQQLAHIR
jgi:HEAT repeat protein